MTTTDHYVVFYSPGTFVSEQTAKRINEWDTKEAAKLAKSIAERHNATPYGFKFETYLSLDPVVDENGISFQVEPKKIKESGFYHLGGKLMTIDQIKQENNPKNNMLIINMESNCPIVIENTNSYRHTFYFQEDHVLLDIEGNPIEFGNDPKWTAYRNEHSRKSPLVPLT